MRGLLSAELLRFRSRRLVRIFALIAFGILVIVQVRLFFDSDRDLAAAQRRAERQAARDAQFVSGGGFADLCEGLKAKGDLDPQTDCATWTPGPPGSEGGEVVAIDPAGYYQDPRLFARSALPDGAEAVAVAMAMIAFVIGASFVGAEWNAGTMQALLFWEPRRARVLLAKGVALVAGVVAITAALQAFCYGALSLIAATRGSTEGVTAGLQTSVLLTVLRGMVIVSATALLGFGIAGLARVTGAALGVGFAYFAVIENLVFWLRPGWQRYLFSQNIAAVLVKKVPVTTGHRPKVYPATQEQVFYQLTSVRGAVTLAVYLGLLLGAFYATFSRRDVT